MGRIVVSSVFIFQFLVSQTPANKSNQGNKVGNQSGRNCANENGPSANNGEPDANDKNAQIQDSLSLSRDSDFRRRLEFEDMRRGHFVKEQ